jgi:uncharacterized membrane protein
VANIPGYGQSRPNGQRRGVAKASLRASDADRDQAIEVLKNAFTEGRLSQDEYNDRMSRTYASKTYGELAAVTSDLPASYPEAPPAYRNRVNSMAVASLVCGVAEFFFGFPAIPAVVFGHIARKQIRQTGEEGNGLAVAGLALGWAAIGLFSLLVVLLAVGAAVAASHSGQVAPGVHLQPGSVVGPQGALPQ